MPKTLTVRHAVDLYLRDRKGEITPRMLESYEATLASFCRHVGTMALTDLTPGTVRVWVKRNPQWRSDSTRRKAVKRVLQVVNFCVAERLISVSPLGRVVLPPETRREAVIEPEQERQLLAVMTPSLRSIFTALMATGRRPDEVCNVRKSEVVTTAEGTLWRMQRHKNRKATGRPADVYLSPAMAALTQELLADEANWTDRLFVTASGRRWTPDYLADRFKLAVTAAGLPSSIVPMSARHTFITRSLLAGVPLGVVAHQVGNSPLVIAHFYSHLDRLSARSYFGFAAQAAG